MVAEAGIGAGDEDGVGGVGDVRVKGRIAGGPPEERNALLGGGWAGSLNCCCCCCHFMICFGVRWEKRMGQ